MGIEGAGEGRSGATVKPEPDGSGPKVPGPEGFPLAGARGVGRLGR